MPKTDREQRATIAEQAAMGYGTRELAELHNLQPASVRRLLATEEMQELVGEARARSLGAAQQGFFKWLLNARQLFEDELDEALEGKRDSRRYILDKIMAQRSSGTHDVNLNVQINNEVVAGLSEVLTEVKAAQAAGREGTPVLVAGHEALPSTSTATTDAEGEVEVLLTHSAKTQRADRLDGADSRAAGIEAARAQSPDDPRN